MSSLHIRTSEVLYFFHIRSGKLGYKDVVGQYLSSPEEAKAQAAVVANDLAEDDDWGGYSVVVTDEHETEIAQVLISK